LKNSITKKTNKFNSLSGNENDMINLEEKNEEKIANANANANGNAKNRKLQYGNNNNKDSNSTIPSKKFFFLI